MVTSQSNPSGRRATVTGAGASLEVVIMGSDRDFVAGGADFIGGTERAGSGAGADAGADADSAGTEDGAAAATAAVASAVSSGRGTFIFVPHLGHTAVVPIMSSVADTFCPHAQ
jgi:hypothetical protein